MGCPCRAPERAGVALDKPASELNLMRGKKSKMGLYGLCGSKMKAKTSANLLLEGQGT